MCLVPSGMLAEIFVKYAATFSKSTHKMFHIFHSYIAIRAIPTLPCLLGLLNIITMVFEMKNGTLVFMSAQNVSGNLNPQGVGGFEN